MYIYVDGFTPIQHWQQLPECSPCPQGPRMLMSTPSLREEIVLSQRSDNYCTKSHTKISNQE